MKYCVIIPDGMADYKVRKLDDRTPLEAARTPNMDRVSSEGRFGVCQTVPRGMAPGSDVAIMSVLGYDPKKYYTGRAPLEAANMNIELGPTDWAVRCNLVTAAGNVLEDFSAGHITTREAELLIGELNRAFANDHIRFYAGVGYRHIMVLRNHPDLALKTVPPHDIQGKRMARYLPKGQGAEIFLDLMKRSVDVLAGHEVNTVRVDLQQNPATMIWLWGEGRKPSFDRFADRFGVNGAVISAVDLVKGLAKLMGLEPLVVPGATGYLDTDYAAKGRYAIAALENVDFVVVHIEAPDEMGHEGNAANKVRAIERVDAEIVGPLLAESERLGGLRMLLMPDHYTPVAERTHTREAVPFAIWGQGVGEASGLPFTEANALSTGLKIRHGHELMGRFIGLS